MYNHNLKPTIPSTRKVLILTKGKSKTNSVHIVTERVNVNIRGYYTHFPLVPSQNINPLSSKSFSCFSCTVVPFCFSFLRNEKELLSKSYHCLATIVSKCLSRLATVERGSTLSERSAIRVDATQVLNALKKDRETKLLIGDFIFNLHAHTPNQVELVVPTIKLFHPIYSLRTLYWELFPHIVSHCHRLSGLQSKWVTHCHILIM